MTLPLFAAPLNSEATPALQWIEVASSFQIPSFHIIGLPGPEVTEARERVRAAIEASGFEFPRRRVVINLSPASIRKHGTGSDLAIALAVLINSGEITLDGKSPCRHTIAAWGELGLGGEIRPARRIVRAVHACWSQGISALVVAKAEYDDARAGLRLLRESGVLSGPEPLIFPASDLREATQLLQGKIQPIPGKSDGNSRCAPPEEAPPSGLLPLSSSLERVVTAAVAGNHHLLLLGPRGTGKSQALEWLLAIQPECLPQVRAKARLISELKDSRPSQDGPASKVPIRRIGAQVRPAALVGSATTTRLVPGEFTLADGGVLIGDELPEWPRDARESLREPLERRVITLTRAQGSLELPAGFVFAGTGNLCPCGGWPQEVPLPAAGAVSPPPRCICSQAARERYLARLSGPILDRMDLIHLVLGHPPTTAHSLAVSPRHRVDELREKIIRTQNLLRRSWGNLPGQLSAPVLEKILEEKSLLQTQLQKLPERSLRARHKLLRIALTLAALDGDSMPGAPHLVEAAFLRNEVRI